jgi:sugar lactone lactonase YvrE
MKTFITKRRILSSLTISALLICCVAIIYRHRQGREVARVNYPHDGMKSFPTAIVADRDGNIYLAAQGENRVLKFSIARHAVVVAGNGRMGFSGDGGPADEASMASPVSIALDTAGNLFIADTGNNRIRRVDAETNTITTVAGDGSMGSRVDSIATSTGLYQPISIAVDSDGNTYIGGTNSVGIRRVDAITRISSKIIGSGMPGEPWINSPATGPFWIAIGEHGSLFFSDPSRNNVSMVTAPEGDVRPIAGSAVCGFAGDGGPSIGALLCFPESLSVNGNRELFIADTGNNRIRRIDLSTGIITSVAGNGHPGYAGDGGVAVNASLNGPMGVTIDRNGYVYIADTGNNCIRRLDTRTGLITTWAGPRDLEVLTSK